MNDLTRNELIELSEKRLKQIQHLLVENKTIKDENKRNIELVKDCYRGVDKTIYKPY